MTKSNELITIHKYLIMPQLKTRPPLGFYLDDVFYQDNEVAASFKNIKCHLAESSSFLDTRIKD